MEYFLQAELFEKLNKLRSDKSYEELIFDSKQTKSNEPKHKKKKKKIIKIMKIKLLKPQNKMRKQKLRMNILAFLKMKKKNYMPHIIWKQTQNKKNCMKK